MRAKYNGGQGVVPGPSIVDQLCAELHVIVPCCSERVEGPNKTRFSRSVKIEA